MSIDELIQSAKNFVLHPETTPHLTVTKSWSQGGTVYGGLSAAMIYSATKESVGDGRWLRVFNCNFIGPVFTEQPFQIEVTKIREGKNLSQFLAKIVQDEKTCVLCQLTFGVTRESKISISSSSQHSMSAPKKAKFIPQIPKVTPKFLRYFDLAMDDGSWPFTGSKHHHIHGWMRYKKAPETLTDAHLIAMIDAWPPTVLQKLRWPVPMSTVNWNIEFIHPHPPFKPNDWFAYQASTRHSADGYTHSEADVWDAKGRLIAISRQTVAIFE